MAPSNRMGKDAVFSVLLRFIHPSKAVRDRFPNPQASHRLNSCTILRLEAKVVNRNSAICVVFRHDRFKDHDGNFIEMHVLPRWIKIEKEGPAEFFFEPSIDAGAAESIVDKQTMPAAALRVAKSGRICGEDVVELASTCEIDDDNEPAPENIPSPTDANVGVSFGEWSHNGVCARRMIGGENVKARLKNFPPNVTPTFLQLFELMIPKDFINEVILVETNKKINGPVLMYGEFLVFVGLQFLMATTRCDNRRDFWSLKNIDPFDGAPHRFGHIMSRRRFEDILQALSYTSSTPPTYKDRFWEVRDWIASWNDNMDMNFVASWISCLDESMSKWLSEYTCPGFIVCPRKPWPLGNEYHTIACGESGILYRVELVEGKDTPPERPAKAFSTKGKTVGLLLRLTEPIWGTSKVVVLDSGFCVLQGIVELRRKGVFSGALIKKRRYWPKHVRGDDIAKHFEDKEIGAVDCWNGKYDEVDVMIVCMKEPDYVLSIMTTYGTLNRVGDDKYRVDAAKRMKKLKYPEVIHNHYTYRDAVDANNSARMDPIALEETMKTTRWPNRVFQFLLAVSEVNAKLAAEKIYGMEATSQQSFRKQLCKELINNPYLATDDTGARRTSPRKAPTEHKLVSLPKNRTFKNGQLKYCKTEYIQLVCSCGKKRVRQYCECSPGVMLCGDCWLEHVRMPSSALFAED